MSKYELKLEFLCEVVGYVTVIRIGSSSWGIRVIYPVVEGGYFKGPNFNGKILPFGADWALIRPDKAFELDVRIILETADGALIHTYYNGVNNLTKEQYDAFLAGKPAKDLKIFVTPRFETSHDKYQWLTRIQAVGLGSAEREGDRVKVSYSWYVLTA